MVEAIDDRTLATAETGQEILPQVLAQDHAPNVIFQEQKQNKVYEYPLQQRISTEWAGILGDDFKPATNVDVFRAKRVELGEVLDDLDQISDDDLKRKLAYLKISAVSLATSYDLDIYDIVTNKLFYVMQEKYPPDAFAQLRAEGNTVDESRAHLRYLYENGEKFLYRDDVGFSEEEEVARNPRDHAFSDLIQDGVDWWQRRALGRDLEPKGGLFVAIDEADELLMEFDNHSDEEINTITDEEKLRDKVGEEIADVIIGVDGYFASRDECVLDWQNFALDRMKDTFRDVPKLRRMGVPTHEAMEYLSECRVRHDNGHPYKQSPTHQYKEPVFRRLNLRPLELDSSSEKLH